MRRITFPDRPKDLPMPGAYDPRFGLGYYGVSGDRLQFIWLRRPTEMIDLGVEVKGLADVYDLNHRLGEWELDVFRQCDVPLLASIEPERRNSYPVQDDMRKVFGVTWTVYIGNDEFPDAVALPPGWSIKKVNESQKHYYCNKRDLPVFDDAITQERWQRYAKAGFVVLNPEGKVWRPYQYRSLLWRGDGEYRWEQPHDGLCGRRDKYARGFDCGEVLDYVA